MEKICVLGLGYVGLTLSVHAAKNGYEVHGVEILEDTRNSIKFGKAPFHNWTSPAGLLVDGPPCREDRGDRSGQRPQKGQEDRAPDDR